jgi:hypothetical protein
MKKPILLALAAVALAAAQSTAQPTTIPYNALRGLQSAPAPCLVAVIQVGTPPVNSFACLTPTSGVSISGTSLMFTFQQDMGPGSLPIGTPPSQSFTLTRVPTFQYGGVGGYVVILDGSLLSSPGDYTVTGTAPTATLTFSAYHPIGVGSIVQIW